MKNLRLGSYIYKYGVMISPKMFLGCKFSPLSRKVWIKPQEINKYLKVVMWILNLDSYGENLKFTVSSIKSLYTSSGSNFAFLYLKECQSLIMSSLAGSPEPHWSSGPCVSSDNQGLPHILDSTIRSLLKGENWKSHRMLLVAIFTVISIYSVFPTRAVPKIETITSPFSGVTQSFESSVLKAAMKDLLGKISFKMKAPSLIILESAGPNSIKSSFGSGPDTLAFLHDFNVLFSFIKFQWMYGSSLMIVWVLWLMAFLAPIYGLFLLLGFTFDSKPSMLLGRLGEVSDQAGKVRMVGITNYWIQYCLKPLHDTLFNMLRQIQTDCTFDQGKKIPDLLALDKATYHCFDLSAATDSLPVALQADMLDMLKPGLGKLWKSLLDFSWFYQNQMIKYSVGQPMGAYSSWGMLALTHHVIVRIAALSVNLKSFHDYAVLGDDIVICNDKVASQYLSLMETLGVSINPSKSVMSKDFMEFAKSWMGPEIDMTPIGPGLILSYVSTNWYCSALMNEAVSLNLIENFPKLLSLVSTTFKGNPVKMWSVIGYGSWWVKMKGDAFAIPFALSSTRNPNLFRYSLWNALQSIALKDWRDSKAKLLKNEEFFYKNWGSTFVSSSWPQSILEFLCKPLSPGFWMYAIFFENCKSEIETFPLLNGEGSWSDIRKLAESIDSINLPSVDWSNSVKMKLSFENMMRLQDEFESSRSESESYFQFDEF